jgi:hypothetical protein
MAALEGVSRRFQGTNPTVLRAFAVCASARMDLQVGMGKDPNRRSKKAAAAVAAVSAGKGDRSEPGAVSGAGPEATPRLGADVGGGLAGGSIASPGPGALFGGRSTQRPPASLDVALGSSHSARQDSPEGTAKAAGAATEAAAGWQSWGGGSAAKGWG